MSADPPMCGEEGCGCPTQADLDAYQERQWHDAGRAVAAMTGLRYDEQVGYQNMNLGRAVVLGQMGMGGGENPSRIDVTASDPVEGFLREWSLHENAPRTKCTECHFESSAGHAPSHAPGCSLEADHE